MAPGAVVRLGQIAKAATATETHDYGVGAFLLAGSERANLVKWALLLQTGGRGVESLIIASAIQRIRSFLIEMCGMKVKPWATAEETLAALHTTLVARHGCSIFWASLRGLLETLARDLKARETASPGALVDNELLDSERYATLLDEIRAVLACQSAEPATFRRLASALSAPALGLLLFLGGAASVGCSSAGLRQAQDASPPAVVDATVVPPEASPDGPVFVTFPDAQTAPVVADATVAQPEANRDLTPPDLTIPDAGPATDVTMAPSQSDGATVTIKDIMDSCNISAQAQQPILACLARLGGSWAEGFAGANCSFVYSQLSCLAESQLCGGFDLIEPSSGTTLDPNTPWICHPVLLYIGVRFV